MINVDDFEGNQIREITLNLAVSGFYVEFMSVPRGLMAFWRFVECFSDQRWQSDFQSEQIREITLNSAVFVFYLEFMCVPRDLEVGTSEQTGPDRGPIRSGRSRLRFNTGPAVLARNSKRTGPEPVRTGPHKMYIFSI